MNSKAMIIKELRKVIEFYGELGFEYLPLKREDIYGLISEKTAITGDRKSTRLNSSHTDISRMPSSA